MSKVKDTNSPKFVIVVRHGELNNPKNIAYNRDSNMDSGDIIRISELGKEQMRNLGRVLREKQFKVVVIKVSPETRAQESARELVKALHSKPKVEIEPDLDDNYCPGPYRLGMSVDDVKRIKGNVYEGEVWQEFHHEMPESIINRMKKVFYEMARSINAGEVGILISHGDPIAWLLNNIISGVVPHPNDLRSSIYPNKGEGFAVVLDSDDRVSSGYSLNADSTNNKY